MCLDVLDWSNGNSQRKSFCISACFDPPCKDDYSCLLCLQLPPHAISVFVIYIFHLSTELLSAIMNVFLVRGLKQLLPWILVPQNVR